MIKSLTGASPGATIDIASPRAIRVAGGAVVMIACAFLVLAVATVADPDPPAPSRPVVAEDAEVNDTASPEDIAAQLQQNLAVQMAICDKLKVKCEAPPPALSRLAEATPAVPIDEAGGVEEECSLRAED